MQVHWLRVILDEGHMLGASLAITNKLQMACSLNAERCTCPLPNSLNTNRAVPSLGPPPLHGPHLSPIVYFETNSVHGCMCCCQPVSSHSAHLNVCQCMVVCVAGGG